MTEVPPLKERLLRLALFGWAVAAIRLALEFAAPDQAWFFGVYFAMPVAIAFVGLRGLWGPVGWRATAGTMVLIGLLVWGIPNSVAYTLAQFLGWEHGRFEPGVQALEIADSAIGKVWKGVAQGFLTSIAGAIWSTLAGTLLIWLPARVRKQRTAES